MPKDRSIIAIASVAAANRQVSAAARPEHDNLASECVDWGKPIVEWNFL
jgi:hypothetical protein